MSTIAEYIREDFKARVEAGRELPGAITLAALADDYDVSLSPVREAVRGLIGDGYLTKRPNGRLELKAGASRKTGARSKAKSQLQPPSPPRNWDEIIAADLVRLSVRGAAEFLREEATAEQYGVGRTLLRQVFGRLAGRGLIEHVPRCGWRLRRFSADAMLEYLEVREAMELKALSLARSKMRREELEAMIAANRGATRSGAPRMDNGLHGYFIQRSGNRFIREFFEQPASRYYTELFSQAAPEAKIVAEMAAQHRAILEAVIAKSWARVERELANHIRVQGPAVEKMLAGIEAASPTFGVTG